MSESSLDDEFTHQATTRSEDETRSLARTLAAALKPGDLVALEGDLGAGKTCFVRGLAEGLGIDPALVSSPTFVIAHEYSGGRTTLAHIDAYRLTGPDDLETIGWSEMRRDEQLIFAIEWPSRINASLPTNRIDVHMQVAGANERSIRISVPQQLADRLKSLNTPEKPAATTNPAHCRKCGRAIDKHAPAYPFCSDRCRMADLGGWFSGGFKVSRPLSGDDEPESSDY